MRNRLSALTNAGIGFAKSADDCRDTPVLRSRAAPEKGQEPVRGLVHSAGKLESRFLHEAYRAVFPENRARHHRIRTR
jgi:hypothetical protein